MRETPSAGPITFPEVLAAGGRFLAMVALIAAEIGLLLLAMGPLFRAGYETLANVVILITFLGFLATMVPAMSAKVIFARLLVFWILGRALPGDGPE